MAIEGKPGALAYFRFTLPLEQARSGSLERASQLALDGLQQQKVHEMARQGERERAPQPEPDGPARRAALLRTDCKVKLSCHARRG